MNVNEIVVGEIYEWDGRRARIDSIGRNADGLAQVQISYGRSFESNYTISAMATYAPDVIRAINMTWVEFKAHKINQKAMREHTDDLANGFREVLGEIGGMHCWMDGRSGLHITGDLEKFDELLLRIRESSATKGGSALESLLG